MADSSLDNARGIASGLIVGTDAAMGAFHRSSGLIRLRAPFVELLTSAITIGSGGTSGREGPIVQMGAGIGSQVASLFKLNLICAGIYQGFEAREQRDSVKK